VTTGSCRSSPVRGSPPEAGGAPASGAGGPASPCSATDPAPAGGRNGSRPCASASWVTRSTTRRTKRKRMPSRLMPPTVRRIATADNRRRPVRQGPPYPRTCYLRRFCISHAFPLSKMACAERTRIDREPDLKREETTSRGSHGLSSSRRLRGEGATCGKLYSAVAFGSPLLTSAEYRNNLARTEATFKGIEAHS
jgi:hypothetical protein